MKKTATIFSLLLTLTLAKSQKLGISTITPTEDLDVNGNLRVRNLPSDIDYKKNSDGLAGGIPIVNSSSFNIVGKTTKADLVPNNKATNFNTSDDSSAMFVIKRFTHLDWPSHQDDIGHNTGMSSSKWVAVMSNIGYSSYGNWEFQDNIFKETKLHGYALFDNGTTWRIWGDINGINDKSDYIDILFINKQLIAQEIRNQNYPFNGQDAVTPAPPTTEPEN